MLSRKLTLLMPLLVVLLSLTGFQRLLSTSLAYTPTIRYPRAFQIECLDCPHSFSTNGDRYLELDSQHTPHLVYAGEGRVLLAWRTPSGWQNEVVAETVLPLGKMASSWTAALDITPDGAARVAYSGDEGLSLASQSPTGWISQVITTDIGLDASVTSIALDINGYAHIPFYDSKSQKLRYAHQSDSGWDFQEIDSGEAVGLVTSFKLDSQGDGHLSYSASKAGGGLRYAHQEDEGWQIQQVDPVLSDINTSLALDAGGQPHISYYTSNSHELRYAALGPSGWITETVATSLERGGESSLAFAPGDIPCIAYSNRLANRMILTCKTQEGWTQKEQFSEVSGQPSLVYSPSNSFQIALFNRDSGQLLWNSQSSSDPVTELVDTSISLEGPLAIQVDPYGYVHVVYHEIEPIFQVRYAYQDAGGWHKQVLSKLTPICEAMALDSQGYPHLTCLEPISHTLEYAYQGAAGWYTQTLSSIGPSGGYASIAIDDEDRPHISYSDGFHQSLIYTHLTSTGWVSETVLSHACFYSSLALNADDLPVIGCIRPDNGKLEIASKETGGWSIEYPDPSMNEGKFISLVLNAVGEPRLSYLNTQPPCSLTYASRNGENWNIEILEQETDGCSGLFPSLKLDAFENPHIAYYDENNGSLKYIFKDGSGWHKQVVDQGDLKGTHSVLVLDQGNQVWIAYMDFGRQDVLLAHTNQERYIYLPIIQTIP